MHLPMETENAIALEVEREEVRDHHVEASNNKSVIISGWRKNYIHGRMILDIIRLSWKLYGHPKDVLRGLKHLSHLRKTFLGDKKLTKIAHAGGKYYISLYNPGWKGEIFEKFMVSQLNDLKPVKSKVYRFNNVIIAITKKCSLQCDHCFEWKSLNKKESLSTSQWVTIVKKLQAQGVSEIQFSGGEPMLKVDRIIDILNEADRKLTSFWIDTSGFKFTAQNAKRLKETGLTGVFVSLDHYDAVIHNEFRGYKEAFHWAQTAVKNALDQDLVVSLSVCITRSFATQENLVKYMELAREWGVHFVQFLEPKAVGHYFGKDVLLLPEHLKVIEEVYRDFNFSSRFLSYPIITYHGFYQRRSGCFSGGYKGFYIDTDGDINPCPFCKKKSGNLAEGNLEEIISTLRSTGCMDYRKVSS